MNFLYNPGGYVHQQLPGQLHNTNLLLMQYSEPRSQDLVYVQPYRKTYKIDLIKPPSTRMAAPLVADANGLE